MPKAIDKEYLVSSLKVFNEQILSETYEKTLNNKTILNKLSESEDGSLTYNGEKISKGISAWSDILNKPFSTIDPTTLSVEDNVLKVIGGQGIEGKSAYQIWLDKGNTGTENDFIMSLKGDKGEDGKDGKSIAAISKDETNNIIVTFSDGSTQNIGKLNVDVQADFLTSDGFGNLRYYNGHFQYYNTTTSSWVDTSVTPNNTFVVNMTPKPIESISAIYNKKIKRFELRWKEPNDTYLDGQLFCVVEKVIIVRKKDSAPETIDDGIKVLEVKRKDFNTHIDTPYIDETFEPVIDEVWYYKAFPISTFGVSNNLSESSKIVARSVSLYGFKIDQNESDPASMITYIEDNKDFRSVHMDYETDTFDYGDWKDAFFMKIKPCMLKYDGTVDYYLNPDDYSLKEDGTPSDIENVDYDGNAMIQFPKVYWKIVDNGDNTANIYFSNIKYDTDFHCWSHIDSKGEEIDYCYMPIYQGYYDGMRLRSLSGQIALNYQTVSHEIDYAKANNQSENVIWYTETFSDRQLVNLLLLLIGKSTDTQFIFGKGYGTDSPNKNNGETNQKGLFWGCEDNTFFVKVFGMENWWGSPSRILSGWICDNPNNTYKIKMTYGQSDGSTTDEYNLTGEGYLNIKINNSFQNGNLSKMKFDNYGFLPIEFKGSSTTYYLGVIIYSLIGSTSGLAVVGNWGTSPYMFSTAFYADNGNKYKIGASVSCKPLANGGAL